MVNSENLDITEDFETLKQKYRVLQESYKNDVAKLKHEIKFLESSYCHQSENELVQSNIRYKELIELAVDGILLGSNDGIIIEANSYICDLAGRSRTELIGLHISDSIFTNNSIQKTPFRFDKLLNGEIVVSERQLINANGNHIDVEMRTKMMPDRTFQSIIRDITSRKSCEHKLMESELRFRNLLQNISSVAIQGYSIDGITQYWNKASEKLYGYSEEEALGRNLLDLIIPDEMLDFVKSSIIEMGFTGIPIPSCELLLKHKDGSLVPVYSSHTILKLPNKPQELFCIDIDLTEIKKAEQALRKSEEKYRQLTEITSDVIWVVNINTQQFTYISPTIINLTGYTVDETVAMSIEQCITPEFVDFVRESIFKDYNEFIQNPEILNPKIYQVKQPCKDGKVIWVEMSSHIRFNSDGDVEVVGVSRNIDERKKIEEQLRESLEQVRKINEEKDKFFSIISHDLRSPFNGFLGLTEVMIKNINLFTNEELLNNMQKIHDSANNLYILLDNLLEWSRIQRGLIEIEPQIINLNKLIDETFGIIVESARIKNISLINLVPKAVEVCIDIQMINTVIRNLLANAIKFTKNYGVVELGILPDQDANFVTIYIRDTGIGIPKKILDNLFKIEFNNSRNGTNNEKGTGLGLILCKEFIEMHGGKIWVESEDGNGSTFFISLPAANTCSLNIMELIK